MKCSACGFDNPEGMKFCGGCGSPLSPACPQCGAEVLAGFQFCGQCGVAVGGAPPAARGRKPAAAGPRSSGDPAERRQLTVMFCDLVGSTALSEQLDPEELRDVIRAYQNAAVKEISRYEGHVAQYLGDGLLVYFGYPHAHEDDAQRAVHAGLGIIAAIGPLNTRLRDLDTELAVRIGLHTGPVVTGEMGSGKTRERLALGQTPNIAARLQGLADPGTLVLGHATYQLVESSFHCELLGTRSLKGVSQPMAVYRVAGKLDSSFEGNAAFELPPLVGREQEISRLLGHYRQARDGHGQTVLLVAEAGVGKSRLVKEFHQRIGSAEHDWLMCGCSPYHQTSALSPIIDLGHKLLELGSGDGPEEDLAKTEKSLRALGFSLPESVPLLASFLSMPLGEAYPPLDLSPQKQREMTLEIVLEILTRLAIERPLVFIMEDLHWADPSTLEFVGLLTRRLAAERIFTLLTTRPTSNGLGASLPLVRVLIERIAREDATRIATGIAGGKPLPREVMEQIVDKTDGVPLFVEELTKTLLESGALEETAGGWVLVGDVASLSIPATLRDSLTARLDHLPGGKEVAQLGAVIGREFSYEMLQAVSNLDRKTLVRNLQLLVDAELLFQRDEPPRATYIFKHALIQDAAYELLLKSTRREHHRRIAETLIERFPERAQSQPELVAQHYSAAELAEPAIRHWLMAGQKAQQRSANLEAAQHLKKGLALVGSLPEGPERDQHEIALQVLLGTTLIFLQGYVAPEVEQAFRRALRVCERSGDPPQLFWVLHGLHSFFEVRADLQEALRLDERMVQIAKSQRDPNLLAVAECCRGITCFFMGEFEKALGLFERADAGGAPGGFAFVKECGVDMEMNVQGFSAICLWHLGYPERSRRRARKALDLARERGHAYSLAVALVFSGLEVHFLQRDPAAVRAYARELSRLTEERGFPLWTCHANIFGGWASFDEAALTAAPGGDAAKVVEESTERIREGLATLAGFGGKGLSYSHFAGVLGEVLGRQGRGAEALSFLRELVSEAEGREDRYSNAELHRLLGEAAWRDAREHPESLAEAEGALREALALARRQGSKALQLRAATSLGRLWSSQGRAGEARELLAPVYGAFTEGFDSRDLKEARELLDELETADAADS